MTQPLDTDRLVALFQRAKARHWARLTYQDALREVAEPADLALLETAEEIVRDARRECGTRRGPTQPRHWDEAIKIAKDGAP